ncbi:MAG: di-heme-cytochrome C peroxidase, partial [Nannocystaceae bacterium]
VLGVFGHVDYPDTATEDGFVSTVRIKKLYELEEWISQLKAPKWPEVFPAIDAAKAARGKEIYSEKNRCSGCHALAPYPLTKANRFGKQFVKINMIALEKIGTDPLAANQATERMAKTGKLAPYFKGAEEVPAIEILRLVVDRIYTREAATLGLTEEQQSAYAGFRIPAQKPPNLAAYKARPLDGVWATSPFLHNGSVPNLYELLLPSKRRSKQFYVGSREFDPKHVGYVASQSPGADTFDTSMPGNSNAGHEYAADLSEEDRWALVEFLKTL